MTVTSEHVATQQPTPDSIIQIGLGFWASKTLLTAVELDVFTILGGSALTASELQTRLSLHPRGTRDFLDALVALRMLDRDGDGPAATYRNTTETGLFLDKSSPACVGGLLEMANSRLYRFWDGLTVALRTGRPQNEIVHTGQSLFDGLAADPERLATFVRAMASIQAGNFHALAETFDFGPYSSVTDVGGAGADLSIILAARHAHLRCVSLDTPAVTPIAAAAVNSAGLASRVSAQAGDMFRVPLPAADVITMCNVLHDWDADQKQYLIGAAFDALADGGALIVVENLIDDARRERAFALLMSLNMLIETDGGFDVTAHDIEQWTTSAGFATFDVRPLAGPGMAAIAVKGATRP
jgi:hypothetical protein